MTDEDGSALPQLEGQQFVTDESIETDLSFHHRIWLPHFAAFPLLERADGRRAARALPRRLREGRRATSACG